MLSTAQAADQLGFSVRRVRALITAGRLKATKLGRDWMITQHALAALVILPGGRPKKNLEKSSRKS